MSRIKSWTLGHGFEISPEKSAVVFFTRHRLTTENVIELSNIRFPVVTKHKYLGMVLDSKLLWTHHIKYIQDKCEKGVNLLKYITNIKWGADTECSLLFYRSYVRSVLDYGSILYGASSTTNLKILDKIQSKCIGICLGAMRSSPVPALLAEVQEMPLYLRRKILSAKCVLKVYARGAHASIGKVCSLSEQYFTNPYWAKKNSPVLADAFQDILPYNEKIIMSSKIPIFELDYEATICKPSVTIPEYTDIPTVNKNIIKLYMLSDPCHVCIYTDGSKSEKGVGCAYYIPTQNVRFSYRLPDECSIYTAEMYAIKHALDYIISNQVRLATILSDSKSALVSLKHNDSKHSRNPLLHQIISLIYKIQTTNRTKLKFLWVKGHSNIQGNDVADQLAKQAVHGQINECGVPYTDILPLIKRKCREKWENDWNKYVRSSNNQYIKIHPTLPSTPQFYPKSKFFSSIKFRLKVEHACTPAHLNRIGIYSSSFCDCDNTTIGNINHILFQCPKYNTYRSEFIRQLLQTDVQLPTDITQLLIDQDRHINTIVKFIKSANIRI